MSPNGELQYFPKGKKIPKTWNKLPEQLETQARDIIKWNKEVERKKEKKKALKEMQKIHDAL